MSHLSSWWSHHSHLGRSWHVLLSVYKHVSLPVDPWLTQFRHTESRSRWSAAWNVFGAFWTPFWRRAAQWFPAESNFRLFPFDFLRADVHCATIEILFMQKIVTWRRPHLQDAGSTRRHQERAKKKTEILGPLPSPALPRTCFVCVLLFFFLSSFVVSFSFFYFFSSICRVFYTRSFIIFILAALLFTFESSQAGCFAMFSSSLWRDASASRIVTASKIEFGFLHHVCSTTWKRGLGPRCCLRESCKYSFFIRILCDSMIMSSWSLEFNLFRFHLRPFTCTGSPSSLNRQGRLLWWLRNGIRWAPSFLQCFFWH